jgi:precorrin-6B methylase 1
MSTTASSTRGRLIVVGTGIMTPEQVTAAAAQAIESADCVLFAMTDARSAAWLGRLNPRARSLAYDRSQPRRRLVYEQMVEDILAEVRRGQSVCTVFYGHPGVLAYAPHEAIRRARREGFSATMLPGISAESCLIADLGVDPGPLGWQSFETTDFLIRPRRFDTCTALVLWQIGMVGELGFSSQERVARPGLAVLQEVLLQHYGADHRAYLYEASSDPAAGPRIDVLRLGDLAGAAVSLLSTLFVPATKAAPLDRAMMERLGLSFDH